MAEFRGATWVLVLDSWFDTFERDSFTLDTSCILNDSSNRFNGSVRIKTEPTQI